MAGIEDPTETGRRIIAIEPNAQTQAALLSWAENAGFNLSWSYSGWPQLSEFFDFHLTIAASKNALALDVRGRPIDPITLRATGFTALGEDGRTPCLVIEPSERLVELREFAIAQGIEPTFDDFRPHISLSYKWDGSPSLDSLTVPDIPLVFNYLVVAQLAEPAPSSIEVAGASDARAESTALVVRDAAAVLPGTRRTNDGYLVAEVRCARTGIQQYLGAEVGRADLPVVNVYRPADEVFSPTALASYAFRPVTVGHPVDGVSPANWKREAVGNTGAEIARDGSFVRVPLVLMDAAAIATVEGGTREISMGYDCRLDWTPGVTADGESYDAIQRGLRMNHLAIVPKGRAGAECRVGDSATPRESADKPEGLDMKTIVIDGVSHKVEDATADLITKMQADAKVAADALAAANAELADALKAADAAKGELDALKAKLPTADQLDAMAAERAKLIADAKRIVPDLDPAGKTADAIRAIVVKSKLGDAAVTNRSADYITAAFDTLTASAVSDPVAAALKSGGTGAAGAASPRDQYLALQSGAWKH